MTKKIQSILYFSLFVIACIVYTTTDSRESETNMYSNSNAEMIQSNTISLYNK